MPLLQYFLPNQETNSFTAPFISILAGALLKYVLGGSIFDLLGHLLVFVGCLNTMYLLKRGNEKQFNFPVSVLILGVLFIGVQVMMIQVFSNWLGIKPLLQ